MEPDVAAFGALVAAVLAVAVTIGVVTSRAHRRPRARWRNGTQ